MLAGQPPPPLSEIPSAAQGRSFVVGDGAGPETASVLVGSMEPGDILQFYDERIPEGTGTLYAARWAGRGFELTGACDGLKHGVIRISADNLCAFFTTCLPSNRGPHPRCISIQVTDEAIDTWDSTGFPFGSLARYVSKQIGRPV